MIEFDRLYKIHQYDDKLINKISQELNIPKLIAKLLVNRGFANSSQCREFLDTDLNNMYDPFMLKDINKGAERILEAINEKEKICIYGDYDVDGITSTSILLIFLKGIGGDCFYYIPNRLEEGYGISKRAVDYISSQKASLIITVDCGITNIEEVEHLKQKNMDIIITDHHQCGDIIPKCSAVINPNRSDDGYPFKKLAGVGVTFKLIQALSSVLNIPVDYEKILPLVAFGTVADIVSLTGENRIIVKNGLNMIKNTTNIGIKALIEVSGLKGRDIDSYHIGFVMGPRLNAAGRLGTARKGVELFLSEDYDSALSIAKELSEENSKRQSIENDILKEAEKLIAEEINLDSEKVIVLQSDKWHSGVIGIVASKLLEKYYRPVILFAVEGDTARGSARSIPAFNIYEGLKSCEGLLQKYGGHKMAAGISINKNNILKFRKEINKIADKVLSKEDLIKEIDIDCAISSQDIELETIEEIKKLEPFGIDNPTPQFILKNGKIENLRTVGKYGKHIKMSITKDGKKVNCIGFDLGEYANILNPKDEINIVGFLGINEYMNILSPQIFIKDIVGNYEYRNKYYYYFKRKLNSGHKYNAENENNISISHSKENRFDYIFDILAKEKGVLILINNYFNLVRVSNRIQTQGRNFFRRICLNFEWDEGEKENSVVFLPNLELIDKNRYNKIILYDFNFNKNELFKFLDDGSDYSVEFLGKEEDIELNKKVLNYIVPSLEDMRIVYRNLFSAKSNFLMIETNPYVHSLSKKLSSGFTKPKLDLILDIFKDCNLIDYIENNGNYNIKLLNRRKEKIDIMNIPKVRYLQKLYSQWTKNQEMTSR